MQLLNGFLVYRGACFVAAVLHLDRPAAYGFAVTRAARTIFSFISSLTLHWGVRYLKWMHSLRESAEVWLPAAGAFPASIVGRFLIGTDLSLTVLPVSAAR